MNMDFDNGTTHPVAKDGEWTPRLNGAVYCSPACGNKCTKDDFDEAIEKAVALAAQLGPDWSANVWENVGWNYDVRKGIAIVNAEENGTFTAQLACTITGTSRIDLSMNRSTPREALEAVAADLRERISILRRALMSVSSEIEDAAMSAPRVR